MMESLFEILSANWLNTLFAIIGISVGIIGFVSSRNSQVDGIPTCQMVSTRLIGKDEQRLPEEIDVTFNGRSVPRLTSTTIFFWNAGRKTIRRLQVVEDDPIRFSFDEGDEILQCFVSAETRKVNKCEVYGVPGAKHTVHFDFDFLDPKDGARIEVLHTSARRYPQILGTIRGIPKGVQEFRFQRSLNSFMNRRVKAARVRRVMAVFVLVSGLGFFVVGLFPDEWFRAWQEYVRSPTSGGAVDAARLRGPLLIAGLLYTLSALMFFTSNRKRYPSELDRTSEVDDGRERPGAAVD